MVDINKGVWLARIERLWTCWHRSIIKFCNIYGHAKHQLGKHHAPVWSCPSYQSQHMRGPFDNILPWWPSHVRLCTTGSVKLRVLGRTGWNFRKIVQCKSQKENSLITKASNFAPIVCSRCAMKSYVTTVLSTPALKHLLWSAPQQQSNTAACKHESQAY